MGIPEYSLLIFNLYNSVISLRLRGVADAGEIARLPANLKLFYSRALCSDAAVAWKATRSNRRESKAASRGNSLKRLSFEEPISSWCSLLISLDVTWVHLFEETASLRYIFSNASTLKF